MYTELSSDISIDYVKVFIWINSQNLKWGFTFGEVAEYLNMDPQLVHDILMDLSHPTVKLVDYHLYDGIKYFGKKG